MELTKTDMNSQYHDGVTWIDIQNPNVEELSKLEQTYGLHPVHLQESTQKVQHNQVEHEENYLFLVMHFPVVDHKTGKLNFAQIGMFLGRDYLITIRTARDKALHELFDEYKTGKGGYFKQGPGYVLYAVVKALLDEISSMTEEVISELDDLEEIVFDNSKSDSQRIGKVRQKIVRLMRLIGPKRALLEDLSGQIGSFTDQRNLPKYYSNNAKMAGRLWEIIEEAKETVEIYKDADFTSSTEQTNSILAILTILFTLTIPITVVGGIYGMNVRLPGGVTATPWNFLGNYTTLILLFIFSSALALGMYVYFRIKRWF
jgi:magnesium transporter